MGLAAEDEEADNFGLAAEDEVDEYGLAAEDEEVDIFNLRSEGWRSMHPGLLQFLSK